MKQMFLVLALIFAVSCNDKAPEKVPVGTPDVDTSIPNSPSGEPPIIEPDPATLPTPEPQPEPVVQTPPPAVEPVLSLTGVKLINASSSQKSKYDKALVIVQKVMKNPEFKKRILAHKRMDGKSGFENTSDTPARVYEKLLQGSETYKTANKDGIAQLEVKFYYENNRTVGYTYPSVGYIKVNTKFFNDYTPSSVAANFIHEYLHKLGYGHDSSATTRRPKSVPYGIGSIMRSLGKQYE